MAALGYSIRNAETMFITIKKFSELTGYSRAAVYGKIHGGEWLQDRVWIKAPDGKILINTEEYEKWAEGRSQVERTGSRI